MSRIVITGASGFIGSAILSAARDRGHEVVGLSTRSTPGLERVDIHDPESMAPHFESADAVIHAAGLAHVFGPSSRDADAFVRANADAVDSVSAAAIRANVRHLVLLSSVSVYGGSNAHGVDEEATCHPAGPYASSKLAGEQRAAHVAAQHQLGLTILRLATVYGEGDRGNIARLMRTIDAGRFVWVGRGTNRKSLIHRNDAAAAVLAVVSTGPSGIRTFNVSADPVLMSDVVHGLARGLGRRVPSIHVPAGVARLAAGAGRLCGLTAPGEVLSKWLADDVYKSEKFRQAFGTVPQVSLAEGLRRQVDRYCSTKPALG